MANRDFAECGRCGRRSEIDLSESRAWGCLELLVQQLRAAVCAHTPGPWSVVDGDTCLCIIAGHAPLDGLLMPCPMSPHSVAEDTANLTLAAAAPELLAALEQCLPLVRAYHRATSEGATSIRAAEAAIAKARG